MTLKFSSFFSVRIDSLLRLNACVRRTFCCFFFFFSYQGNKKNSSSTEPNKGKNEAWIVQLWIEQPAQDNRKEILILRTGSTDGWQMATTSDNAANLNVARELNISFENLSYNAKRGLFKRSEFAQRLWFILLRFSCITFVTDCFTSLHAART